MYQASQQWFRDIQSKTFSICHRMSLVRWCLLLMKSTLIFLIQMMILQRFKIFLRNANYSRTSKHNIYLNTSFSRLKNHKWRVRMISKGSRSNWLTFRQKYSMTTWRHKKSSRVSPLPLYPMKWEILLILSYLNARSRSKI